MAETHVTLHVMEDEIVNNFVVRKSIVLLSVGRDRERLQGNELLKYGAYVEIRRKLKLTDLT